VKKSSNENARQLEELIQALENSSKENLRQLTKFEDVLTSLQESHTNLEWGVHRLKQHKDDHERRTILNWLTPIDYAPQQSDFISRRQEGTGQWLLDSNEFQEWLNTSRQTLFCPGIPGAGKTIITSIIIEHLSTKFHNDSNTGIAYLYCNYRQQQKQKPIDLLASLLKQLVQEKPSMHESVKNLYERHKDKRTCPSLEEILKALHSVVVDYSRAFIIIDALDECQVTDGCRTRLLSEIFNLQGKYGTNVFATSRFIPEITEKVKGSTLLEIRARDEDVQKYLDSRISQSESRFLKSCHEEIKIEITKAVDGMCVPSHVDLVNY
jgi:Cdc6-like AAA superfamily ATPase